MNNSTNNKFISIFDKIIKHEKNANKISHDLIHLGILWQISFYCISFGTLILILAKALQINFLLLISLFFVGLGFLIFAIKLIYFVLQFILGKTNLFKMIIDRTIYDAVNIDFPTIKTLSNETISDLKNCLITSKLASERRINRRNMLLGAFGLQSIILLILAIIFPHNLITSKYSEINNLIAVAFAGFYIGAFLEQIQLNKIKEYILLIEFVIEAK